MVVDERVEVFAEGEGRVEGARLVEVDVGERRDGFGVGGRGKQRRAGERRTVQRDVVHVIRLLDCCKECARLSDADICEAAEFHLAPRFPLGFEPNTHRPFLVGPS